MNEFRPVPRLRAVVCTEHFGVYTTSTTAAEHLRKKHGRARGRAAAAALLAEANAAADTAGVPTDPAPTLRPSLVPAPAIDELPTFDGFACRACGLYAHRRMRPVLDHARRCAAAARAGVVDAAAVIPCAVQTAASRGARNAVFARVTRRPPSDASPAIVGVPEGAALEAFGAACGAVGVGGAVPRGGVGRVVSRAHQLYDALGWLPRTHEEVEKLLDLAQRARADRENGWYRAGSTCAARGFAAALAASTIALRHLVNRGLTFVGGAEVARDALRAPSSETVKHYADVGGRLLAFAERCLVGGSAPVSAAVACADALSAELRAAPPTLAAGPDGDARAIAVLDRLFRTPAVPRVGLGEPLVVLFVRAAAIDADAAAAGRGLVLLPPETVRKIVAALSFCVKACALHEAVRILRARERAVAAGAMPPAGDPHEQPVGPYHVQDTRRGLVGDAELDAALSPATDGASVFATLAYLGRAARQHSDDHAMVFLERAPGVYGCTGETVRSRALQTLWRDLLGEVARRTTGVFGGALALARLLPPPPDDELVASDTGGPHGHLCPATTAQRQAALAVAAVRTALRDGARSARLADAVVEPLAALLLVDVGAGPRATDSVALRHAGGSGAGTERSVFLDADGRVVLRHSSAKTPGAPLVARRLSAEATQALLRFLALVHPVLVWCGLPRMRGWRPDTPLGALGVADRVEVLGQLDARRHVFLRADGTVLSAEAFRRAFRARFSAAVRGENTRASGGIPQEPVSCGVATYRQLVPLVFARELVPRVREACRRAPADAAAACVACDASVRLYFGCGPAAAFEVGQSHSSATAAAAYANLAAAGGLTEAARHALLLPHAARLWHAFLRAEGPLLCSCPPSPLPRPRPRKRARSDAAAAEQEDGHGDSDSDGGGDGGGDDNNDDDNDDDGGGALDEWERLCLTRLRQWYGADAHFRNDAQREASLRVLAGGNLFCVMAAGGGKSVIFQLAHALRGGCTVLVVPLRALQQDQLRRAESLGLRAKLLRDFDVHDEADRLHTLFACTPETLARPRGRAALRTLADSGALRLIAFDEAHVLDVHAHFRPALLDVGALAGRQPGVVLAAVSATARAVVRARVMRALCMLPDATAIVTGPLDRPNLRLEVRRSATRQVAAAHLLEELACERPARAPLVIVFVPFVVDTADTVALLAQHGHAAVAYHGALSELEQAHAVDRWRGGEAPVLVGTGAFRMGVDELRVGTVVHLGGVRTLDDYYQEAGRAGRDPDLRARATLLFCEETFAALVRIHTQGGGEESLNDDGGGDDVDEQEDPHAALRAVRTYALLPATACRREHLLRALEDSAPEMCRAASPRTAASPCDLCLLPRAAAGAGRQIEEAVEGRRRANAQHAAAASLVELLRRTDGLCVFCAASGGGAVRHGIPPCPRMRCRCLLCAELGHDRAACEVLRGAGVCFRCGLPPQVGGEQMHRDGVFWTGCVVVGARGLAAVRPRTVQLPFALRAFAPQRLPPELRGLSRAAFARRIFQVQRGADLAGSIPLGATLFLEIMNTVAL